MAAPGPVNAQNARIYGHPVDVQGDTSFGGGVAHLRALDIPPKQFVEMRLLFPRDRDLAYRWMTQPNRRFGTRPVDLVIEHGFEGLLSVRRYLDFQRGQ